MRGMAKRLRGWQALLVGALVLGAAGEASAANVVIGTFDTGIDVEALITAVVAVFAPLLLLIMTMKYGFRLVKSVASAAGRLFSARA